MDIRNEANVPPEALDRIFMHCESTFMANEYATSFTPESHLHPLLFVCKRWHDIAERRLYMSVSLGSNGHIVDRNGSKTLIHGRKKCRQFRETVQNNPRLASLVRELHLATRNFRPEETKDHIRLLKICKNVKVLQIRGCAEGLEEQLKAALAEANLISFKFSIHYAWYEYCHGARVFTASELLSVAQNWPCLNFLQASLGDDIDSGISQMNMSIPSSSPIVRCQSLCVVTIKGNCMESTQLTLLASIAPNLERLVLSMDTDCNAALQRCLQGWSSTLEFLHVSGSILKTNGEFIRNWRVACPIICSPLIALRELNASLPLLPTSALVYLLNLRTLTYHGEYDEGVKVARIIEDGRLPHLLHLEVFYYRSYDNDATPSASSDITLNEVAQELRRACGPRNIELIDSASGLEGFEEESGTGYEEPESPEFSDDDWPHFIPTEAYEEDKLSFTSGTTDSDPQANDEFWDSD